jgi:hypothetical protein
MGLFDNFNPFDPGGLMGGGGGGGGGGGDDAAQGGGVAVIPGAGDEKKDEGALDVQKAYGFGVAGTGNAQGGSSRFDQMRRRQMGMGGSSGG